MAEHSCMQIEITKAYGMSEWRDDLKNTMMKAGVENRGIVFLFSDAQVNKLHALYSYQKSKIVNLRVAVTAHSLVSI